MTLLFTLVCCAPREFLWNSSYQIQTETSRGAQGAPTVYNPFIRAFVYTIIIHYCARCCKCDFRTVGTADVAGCRRRRNGEIKTLVSQQASRVCDETNFYCTVAVGYSWSHTRIIRITFYSGATTAYRTPGSGYRVFIIPSAPPVACKVLGGSQKLLNGIRAESKLRLEVGENIK